MAQTPACPSCYLRHIVCKTCKRDKPKCPSGAWIGSWWYCDSECGKTAAPPGQTCKTHWAAMEKLRVGYPHLFPAYKGA